MGNNSSGDVKAARSTLFATAVTGSGATTELTLTGSYKNLRTDLIAWDQSNGHGLGANALGFAAGAAEGQIPKEINGFNVEGMDFAANGTAYLGFRAPLLPQADGHLALVVPVTNLTSLVTGGGPATFGAPMLWNLGGLGVREIRRNADGQYLVIAGGFDEGGDFFLYSWDGNPAHQPARLTTVLPPPEGAWEGIVSTPDPLVDVRPCSLSRTTATSTSTPTTRPSRPRRCRSALRKARIDTFSIQLPAPPTWGSVPPSQPRREATGPGGAAVTYSKAGRDRPITRARSSACLPGLRAHLPARGDDGLVYRRVTSRAWTSVPATFTVTVSIIRRRRSIAGVPASIRSRHRPTRRAGSVTFATPTADRHRRRHRPGHLPSRPRARRSRSVRQPSPVWRPTTHSEPEPAPVHGRDRRDRL